MTLKMHIGSLILLIMMLFLIWSLRDDLIRKFAWHVPIAAGCIVFGIVESFGWVVWFFFFAP